MGATILLVNKLREYPLFTVNDISKHLRKSRNYSAILAFRLVKKGVIRRITKGKFTMYDNPLIFLSHIYTPTYIGSWSALRFYNMTTQLPKDFFVVTTRRRKTLDCKDYKINFVAIPTKNFWGFKKEKYLGFEIFVSDPEKTIIDCILTKKVPLSAVYEAISNSEIDVKKMVNYLTRIQNSSLTKRVGYLMEKCGLDIRKDVAKLIDNNYIFLSNTAPKRRVKNEKWRLFENMVIG